MSVQAISWVLDHSPTRGNDRLVLISLANHAGKSPVSGAWESYPGVETIAREAGIARHRTVQDALARLVAEGHIERIVNGAPDSRIRADRRPNLYRILIRRRGDGFRHPEISTGVSENVTPQNARGDVLRPNGVTESDANGVTESVTQTVIKNRHRTPSGTYVSRARLSPGPDAAASKHARLAQRAAEVARRAGQEEAS